jgi:hypothetical protein
LRQQALDLDATAPGYVIDTSALIDLHRVVYAPDVFKTLWENLAGLVRERRLLAPREVYNEISKRDDDLYAWSKLHKQMFCEPDSRQQAIVRQILTSHPRLVDASKDTPDADPFVVALAEAGSHVVVCSEKGNMQGRVRIPDVCRARRVRCIRPLEMFRELKWSF